MKFAICNETFKDWPFEKAFQFARECGYTGIEFAPFTIHKNVYEISAEQRAEVRRQAEQAELEVVGLHWLLAFTEGYYLTTPDAAVRKSTAEYLILLVIVAIAAIGFWGSFSDSVEKRVDKAGQKLENL